MKFELDLIRERTFWLGAVDVEGPRSFIASGGMGLDGWDPSKIFEPALVKLYDFDKEE